MLQTASLILTRREMEVIDKKLNKMRLTQQDSNYLSRYVRPKLREIGQIDSNRLLLQIEYNQEVPAIEKRIKRLILDNVRDVSSITIYGSAIYNNYKDYNDIDVIVAVKKKSWEKLGEKYRLIIDIKKKAKKKGLKLDLEIYTEEEIINSYPTNVTLIYQLKDSKTIYGELRLPSRIELYKLALRMKADYSIIGEDEINSTSGQELYRAIRNLWIIRLILDKIVDNFVLNKTVEEELGKNMVCRLKNNKCNLIDKKMAFLYLNWLLDDTLKNLEDSKWEKMQL